MKLRKELNNKGFSLVELLIATVILAIVVAPLLHTFVTAANTTARSRRIGDATLVSENIAERVEATALSELFNEPDPGKYFDGATAKGLYSFDGSTYTLGADPAVTDCYYLGVHGVRAGASTFNAMITLDAAAYRTEDQDGINDQMIADYSNMDAAYAQSRDADDPDQLGWASFREKADALHSDWSANTDPIRHITLKVTEQEEKIYADLVFQYQYSYIYSEADDVTGEVFTHSGTLTSDEISYSLLPQGYSLETNGGKLPNIYVIYYPLYGANSVTNDVISIENDIAQPFKLFLVKQRGDDLSGELQYHAAVEQYVPAGTPTTNYAVVYSNIREDLSNELNTAPLAGVSYRIYRGDFFSRTGTFAGEHGDLVSKSGKNRIFEITVQVFASDDSTFTTPLYTFKSTKLQ